MAEIAEKEVLPIFEIVNEVYLGGRGEIFLDKIFYSVDPDQPSFLAEREAHSLSKKSNKEKFYSPEIKPEEVLVEIELMWDVERSPERLGDRQGYSLRANLYQYDLITLRGGGVGRTSESRYSYIGAEWKKYFEKDVPFILGFLGACSWSSKRT